jgi:hypothetical protein
MTSVVQPLPPPIMYTIAVGGSMNPAIHSLLWYRVIDAIDENEYQASLRFPLNTTTQLFSQLRFASTKIMIQCQQNEWSIQGFSDAAWPMMVKVAGLVFEKLNETPVTAYAMVTQKHLDTRLPDVKAALADKVYGMNLAFPHSDDNLGSHIEMTMGIADYQVKLALEPSVRGIDKLFLFYQHQYFPPQEPGKYFDIGKLISERVDAFCEAQSTHCKNIIAALSE